CTDFWNRDVVDAKEFEARSRELKCPRGVGLPGRVWEGGEPAWIEDVALDRNFPRGRSATAAGVHSGFCFSVKGGGGGVGGLSLFLFSFFLCCCKILG